MTASYTSAGSFSQAYDRRGNVTSEGRTLTGVTGDAGTNAQAFTYDGAGRLTGSSGLSASSAYTYDRDGDRLTRTDGPDTTTFVYDRTDELVSQSVNGGGSTSFVYDAYGNGTSSRDKTGAVTTSAYDAADRLRTLTPPSGSFAATFSFDALGRIATRSVATTPTATLDTYAHAATAETVATITTTGGASATLTSVVDPAGSRLTTSTGTLAYALPDLHGSTAALENASRVLTAAYRFDGWGQTIASYPAVSPPANPFRYRGLLDVSSDASNPLYDMGARFYSPGLGTFTQLDSLRGSAEDPASLNRFLYAEGNPATLIDPDGHGVDCGLGEVCTAEAKSADLQRLQTYYQASKQTYVPSSDEKPRVIGPGATPGSFRPGPSFGDDLLNGIRNIHTAGACLGGSGGNLLVGTTSVCFIKDDEGRRAITLTGGGGVGYTGDGSVGPSAFVSDGKSVDDQWLYFDSIGVGAGRVALAEGTFSWGKGSLGQDVKNATFGVAVGKGVSAYRAGTETYVYRNESVMDALSWTLPVNPWVASDLIFAARDFILGFTGAGTQP